MSKRVLTAALALAMAAMSCTTTSLDQQTPPGKVPPPNTATAPQDEPAAKPPTVR